MVLLEALACGLPIVAVGEGGVEEIISDEKLGVLVSRNEEEFAEEILKQAMPAGRQLQDDEKMYRHEWVKKNWSWEKSVKELEKHLQEVAK